MYQQIWRTVRNCTMRKNVVTLACGLLLIVVLHRYTCKWQASTYSTTSWEQDFTAEENEKIQEWLHRRKEAQASSSAKNVLLFAYMRGGSTILSESFSNNPDIFFWYEPLDQFYSSILGSYYHFPISHSLFLPTYTLRAIPEWESALLAEYIHNMYTCRLRDLPIEALTHYKTYWGTSFRPLQTCLSQRNVKVNERISNKCKDHISHCFGNVAVSLKNNCTAYIQHFNKKQGLQWPRLPGSETGLPKLAHAADGLSERFAQHAACLDGFWRTLDPCLDDMVSACNQKRIHVSKILKLTMDSVDEVLERSPDLALIYFVRDPRAIATSRKDTQITFSESSGEMIPEAMVICQKMRNDLALYRRLRRRYPGAMALFRYEDLVLDLRGTLRRMYAHFGEDVPRDVYDAVYGMMNAGAGAQDEAMFSVRRSDAKQSLRKWLTKNSQQDIDGMTKHCSDILEAFGYPYEMSQDQEYPPLPSF